MNRTVWLIALVLGLAQPSSLLSQTFDIRYFGNGVATLVPGSANPVGSSIAPGQSFVWRISAQNGAYWSVANNNSFFPFMAFEVAEDGVRIGNYGLTLFRNGNSVFSESANDVEQTYNHLGTNDISLSSGLKFDRMELSYFLTSSVDPVSGLPIGSTIHGMLPYFGAPEQNPYDVGVQYVNAVSVVPEPSSIVLMPIGLIVIGVVVRRRNL